MRIRMAIYPHDVVTPADLPDMPQKTITQQQLSDLVYNSLSWEDPCAHTRDLYRITDIPKAIELQEHIKMVLDELDRARARIPPIPKKHHTLDKISKVIWALVGMQHKGETCTTEVNVGRLYRKYDPAETIDAD